MSRAAAKRFRLTSYFHSNHPIKLNQIESNEVQDPAPSLYLYLYRLASLILIGYLSTVCGNTEQKKKKNQIPSLIAPFRTYSAAGLSLLPILSFSVYACDTICSDSESKSYSTASGPVADLFPLEIIDGDKCDNDNDNRPSTINERRVPER